MTAALVLLAYAALLATIAATALGRAGWTLRTPRLGILAWQALSLSVLGSVLLAGAMAYATRGDGAGRCGPASHWPCPPGMSPYDVALSAGTLIVVALVVARVVWCLVATRFTAARRRHDQLDALAVLGRTDDRLGVTLVEHDTPSAYCLSGRRGRIVVTTGALRALDERSLTAVLDHERAHLAQHHHLFRMTAEALARAFPFVPVFTIGRDEIARLTELAADDAAASRSGRLTVAAALLDLAEATATTAPALTAGGPTTASRAQRLIRGERRVGRVRILLGLAAAFVVLAVPAAAVAASVPTAPATGCCTALHGPAQP
jgi:Zn-dependent protease with chaperone function